MKKIYIYFILILCLISSCKTQKQDRTVSGTYVFNYENEEKEEIIFNEDGTFIFTSYKTSCEGSWRYISKDTIILKCYEPSISQSLSKGYVYPLERKIKILKNNKLKMPVYNNVKRKYVTLNPVR